jgi:hypothetical protein
MQIVVMLHQRSGPVNSKKCKNFSDQKSSLPGTVPPSLRHLTHRKLSADIRQAYPQPTDNFRHFRPPIVPPGTLKCPNVLHFNDVWAAMLSWHWFCACITRRAMEGGRTEAQAGWTVMGA